MEYVFRQRHRKLVVHSCVMKVLMPKESNSKVTISQWFTCRLNKSSFLLQQLVENLLSIFKDCPRKHFHVISATLTRARLDYAP